MAIFIDKDPEYASKNALSGMFAVLSSGYVADVLSAVNTVILKFGGKILVDINSLNAFQASTSGILMTSTSNEDDEEAPRVYIQDGQLMSTSLDGNEAQYDVKLVLVDNATSSDYYEMMMDDSGTLATTKIDDQSTIQMNSVMKWIEIEDNTGTKYKLSMNNGNLQIEDLAEEE